MNPIRQNWINFKAHSCTAHHKIKKNGKLTMEDAVFLQANLVNDMVAHMSGLPFPYPPQVCQEQVYILIPNSAPTIAPIIQPSPSANAATDAASNILHQLITSMQHMQQHMVQMHTIQSGRGGQTRNRNTRRPHTLQAATKPIQGQPHKPLPDFATKYF